MKKLFLLLAFGISGNLAHAQWALTGNSGTNPAINFMGTTDNVPLVIKANNTRVGFLNSPLGMVVFGRNAGTNLSSFTTGNVILGDSAAGSTPSNAGSSAIVIGDRAGKSASQLTQNILIGNQAGEKNSASNVTLIGLFSGLQNAGSGNTMVGAFSGQANTSGDGNSFFGSSAGTATTTGRQNGFFGMNSGISNTTGSQNTFSGPFAGLKNTNGSHNTYVGFMTGANATTGSGNTFLGDSAGLSNVGGGDNVAIGRKARFTVSNLTNAIAIGTNTAVGASNSMVLGNGVNVGIGTSSPSEKLHVVGSIRMVDGNEGVGKVLTSDANGKAIWQSPAPVAPTGPASGDLSGTYPNPAVAKIQGTAVSATTPTTGQVLAFNGTTALWQNPAPVAPTGTASGDLSGTYPNPAVAKIQGTLVSTTVPISGQVLAFNGTTALWQNPAPSAPTGTASGDLAGTYPNPTVDAIQGFSISSTPPANGQVLQYNAGTFTWTPTSLPGASNDWTISGNSGTNGSTSFIGTTDNISLNFRTNNVRAGKLDHVNNNTLFGTSSGSAAVTGTDNTLIGASAGTALSTGLSNTCVGKGSGSAITSSVNNTFLGTNAGNLNTSSNNTYLGRAAGAVSTTGTDNVYVGSSSGAASTTGGFNTFIGSSAALIHATGDNNTIIGRTAASSLTSGASNTIIGAGASAGTTRTNGIALGQNANVILDNCAVIGNSLITKIGIGKTPAAANILEFQVTTAKLTTGGVWTNASDRRIKDNVTKLDKKEILSKIENLDISRWHYKADADPVTHIGPMSQDFYAAFQTGDETTISTIDPSGVALIGIQQLSLENKELRKENDILKARLDKIEAMLVSNQTITQKLVLGMEGKTAMLGQNFPNPVAGKTTIEFYIPNSVKSAYLVVNCLSGKQLIEEPLLSRGNGSIELDVTKLAAGCYLYRLVVDAEKIDGGQMVVGN
ncbi:MAG TPA: tail fiber domain-containing protein [Catalimonadaceae bacterium]|nr:tail fiber domain-containing protein [Catalimonadaceae bacterium]